MTSAPSHASASVHEVPASNWVRSRTFTSSNAVFCDMVWPLLSANGSVPAHVSFFGAPRYVRYATPILPRQKSLTDLDDAPRATHHPARRVPSGRRGRLRESPFMSPLFDVFIEVVVDPKIVADWPFPGWDGGDVGHTWRTR